MQLPYGFIGVAIVLFGLVFGSFANVVIWRFPRSESLSSPASHCPSCGHPIRWYDNIPVLSWLLLRGRCRDCAAPIASRYPLVETLSGLLWLAAWLKHGWSVSTIFAIVFFYLLLILAFIDLDTMRLPNALVGLLAGIGLIGVVLSHALGTRALPLLPADPGAFHTPLVWALLGVAVGALPALVISLAYSKARGAQGMGMGDVKLLAASGFFLGPYSALVLFVGSVIGVVIPLVRSGGRMDAKAQIPFGPSLALAAVLVTLWGEQLVSWYFKLLS